MKKLIDRLIKREIYYFLLASLLGFFFLAWAGLVLAPLSFFIIDRVVTKYRKKNKYFLRWLFWILIGSSISLIHLINYPSSLLFYNENDLNSENSINSVIDRISRECSVKKLVSIDNSFFDYPKLVGYKILPLNASCNGDEEGKIRAVRTKENIIINWWTLTSYNPFLSKSLPKQIIYDVDTGIKSCIPSDNDHFCTLGR